MKRIEKVRQILGYEDGVQVAVVDLQVSTAAELPALNAVVDGTKVAAGSIAQIIQADEPTYMTLDENGTWYPEQSSSASTLSAPLSTPLTLGKTVKPAVIEPDFEESIEEPEKDGDDDAELL